jgi:hypothetical protein
VLLGKTSVESVLGCYIVTPESIRTPHYFRAFVAPVYDIIEHIIAHISNSSPCSCNTDGYLYNGLIHPPTVPTVLYYAVLAHAGICLPACGVGITTGRLH